MNEIKVEEVLKRFMIAANLNSLQNVASAIGVSANSISGWKSRNSVGAAFEHMYPYLLKYNISFYYVFFNIGVKNLNPRDLFETNDIENRLKKVEEVLFGNI